MKDGKVARPTVLLSALAAVVCAFQVYGPGMSGPFVFDDLTLPYGGPTAADLPFPAWLGVRPLLMLTYWLNYRLSGPSTFSYHVFNVLLHIANAALVFLIVRRILEWAAVEIWRRRILAVFAAAVFLLHPIATESVTYVAGRSETMSVLLFLSAFAVFLYRRSAAVSWRAAIVILILFAAAMNTKEHTAMLPLVLLLTDYYWNPGFSSTGIRRNWRLYVAIAMTSIAGVMFLLRYLSGANTIGFHLKNVTWYQYFFTQWRALFLYFRLYLFPMGQNVDHDFAISRTIFDHGAIMALAGMLLLVGAAIYFRRRYSLASYGLLMSLILFAPTSSVIPIADPVAERRVYLPTIGLLFVAMEVLRRVRWERKTLIVTLGSICAVLAILTYQRNEVWSSDIALEADAVAKAPRNPRAHEQLGFAYFFAGRCEEAEREYAAAAEYQLPNYPLYLDWGVALDCNNQLDKALEILQKAAALQPTADAYAAIGKVLSRQGRWADSLAALETAAKIDPAFARTYIYRGAVRQDLGQLDGAEADYRLALHYDPRNQNARDLLMRLQAQRNSRP